VVLVFCFFFQAEDGIRDFHVTGVQTCALPIWWLGIGVSFSFICGELQRAPRWMQRCGLEWLHRLMQEPTRLARRYLVHGIPFARSEERRVGKEWRSRWPP